MSETTRVVFSDRLLPSSARNEETRFSDCSLDQAQEEPSFSTYFDFHHKEMAAKLRSEDRRGVMAFVLGAKVEGGLWLAATDELRTGSIGRHTSTDLYLPEPCSLSLRTCLLMVRAVDDDTRIDLLDLSSMAGLLTEQCAAKGPVRAIEATGHFLAGMAGYILAVFPTGEPLPWDPDAADPFATLAPRRLHPRYLGEQMWKSAGPKHEATQVARPGPRILDDEPLCPPGELPAGHLLLRTESKAQRIPVGFSALDCGLLLGRDSRCSGFQVLGDSRVSRVHAVLVRRDHRVYLIDTGSTNGTSIDDRLIKCADITCGGTFKLGGAAATWRPLD